MHLCLLQFLGKTIPSGDVTTETTTIEEIIEVDTRCEQDEEYSSCAIQCDRLCMYYAYSIQQQGSCLTNNKCEAGCQSLKTVECSMGMFWMNEDTCVTIADCMCRTPDGTHLKPGTLYKESECKICQCVDNFYLCDVSTCEGENGEVTEYTEETQTLEQKTVHVISTITPPHECLPDRYVITFLI